MTLCEPRSNASFRRDLDPAGLGKIGTPTPVYAGGGSRNLQGSRIGGDAGDIPAPVLIICTGANECRKA